MNIKKTQLSFWLVYIVKKQKILLKEKLILM